MVRSLSRQWPPALCHAVVACDHARRADVIGSRLRQPALDPGVRADFEIILEAAKVLNAALGCAIAVAEFERALGRPMSSSVKCLAEIAVNMSPEPESRLIEFTPAPAYTSLPWKP
jgi:hypothetical protein